MALRRALARVLPFLLSLGIVGAIAVVQMDHSTDNGQRAERMLRADRVNLQSTLSLLTASYFGYIVRTENENVQRASWTLEPGSAADRQTLTGLAQRQLGRSLGNRLVRLDGVVLNEHRATGTAELPPPTDAGYAPALAALRALKPGFSDVMSVRGVDMIAVAVPVIQGGIPRAVVVTHYPVSDDTLLADFLRRLSLDDGGTAYAVDSTGTVIAASRPGLAGTSLGEHPAVRAAADSGTGIRELGSGDDAMVTSYAGLDLSQYVTLITEPADTFYALARDGAGVNLPLVALLAAGALALAVVNDRRHVALRRLADEAVIDPLTRLPNRLAFEDRLKSLIGRMDADDTAAVLFLDLDDFKPVNDRHGHAAGDEVLVQVALRLRGAVRTSDTVARIGGDEFVVLLADATDRDLVEVVAERVAATVRDDYAVAGEVVRIGVSVGTAFARRGDSVDDVIRSADTDMYRVKESSRAVRTGDRRTRT